MEALVIDAPAETVPAPMAAPLTLKIGEVEYPISCTNGTLTYLEQENASIMNPRWSPVVVGRIVAKAIISRCVYDKTKNKVVVKLPDPFESDDDFDDVWYGLDGAFILILKDRVDKLMMRDVVQSDKLPNELLEALKKALAKS